MTDYIKNIWSGIKNIFSPPPARTNSNGIRNRNFLHEYSSSSNQFLHSKNNNHYTGFVGQPQRFYQTDQAFRRNSDLFLSSHLSRHNNNNNHQQQPLERNSFNFGPFSPQFGAFKSNTIGNNLCPAFGRKRSADTAFASDIYFRNRYIDEEDDDDLRLPTTKRYLSSSSAAGSAATASLAAASNSIFRNLNGPTTSTPYINEANMSRPLKGFTTNKKYRKPMPEPEVIEIDDDDEELESTVPATKIETSKSQATQTSSTSSSSSISTHQKSRGISRPVLPSSRISTSRVESSFARLDLLSSRRTSTPNLESRQFGHSNFHPIPTSGRKPIMNFYGKKTSVTLPNYESRLGARGGSAVSTSTDSALSSKLAAERSEPVPRLFSVKEKPPTPRHWSLSIGSGSHFTRSKIQDSNFSLSKSPSTSSSDDVKVVSDGEEKVPEELGDEAMPSAKTSRSSSSDDLQILSERIVTPRRQSSGIINTLELQTRQEPRREKNWLIDLIKQYRENEENRKSKIDYETKRIQILRGESDLDKAVDKKIRRSLTVTEYIVLEPQTVELPKITPEMQKIIDNALRLRNDSEVLATAFNIQITRSDLKTLIPCQWLNDNVINTYMDMIALRNRNEPKLPKVHVFTTFFYPKFMKEGYSNILKRWTRKVDIFSFDLLLFPIHLGVHWCLATADLRTKQVNFYDSLNGNHMNALKGLLKYLSCEMRERKGTDLNTLEWNLEQSTDIPQQENGSDCGVFTCKFAEYLSRDAPLTFKQGDMNYYRHRMVYEIIKQDLMFP